jgi:DNA-binding beta-propeller fold protein YncE
MRRMTLIWVLIAGAMLVGAAGCSSPPVAPEIVWPQPPASPRIVWEDNFHGSLDLERSFFGKIKDFMFGAAEPMALQRPWGLTFDKKGRLYVADTGAHAVVVTDFGAGTVKRWESLGLRGAFSEPINITVVDDEVFVLDAGLKRVVVLGLDGEFRRFLLPEPGFERPVGIVWDEMRGEFLIVDSGAHELVIVTPTGEIRDRWGRRGDARGEFHYPLGVGIHPNGLVYIVDSFHFAVQVFDRSGEFRFSFGSSADAIGSMARPRDIAFDSDGNVYVTDAMLQEFQVYDPDGELLLRVGAEGQGNGQFRLPAGIWVDEDDRVYVVDSINQRVQRFRYLAESRKEQER